MVKKKGNNSASSIANKPLSRFLTLKEERMRMNATLKANIIPKRLSLRLIRTPKEMEASSSIKG